MSKKIPGQYNPGPHGAKLRGPSPDYSIPALKSAWPLRGAACRRYEKFLARPCLYVVSTPRRASASLSKNSTRRDLAHATCHLNGNVAPAARQSEQIPAAAWSPPGLQFEHWNSLSISTDAAPLSGVHSTIIFNPVVVKGLLDTNEFH